MLDIYSYRLYNVGMVEKTKQQQRIMAAFKDVDKKRLARLLGSNMNTLYQVTSGNLQVSAQRAIKIEKYAGVKKSILRPDIFQD